MPENAVQTEKLSKRFGKFEAVKNLDLAVPEGEIFGFLGANGAGKTTAIRMLCGLLLPSSGTGKVAGFDILKENEKIKQRIGERLRQVIELQIRDEELPGPTGS